LDSGGEYTIRLTRGVDEGQLAAASIEGMALYWSTEGRFYDKIKVTIIENVQYYMVESINNCQMREKVKDLE
jgi:hypothetical protein